MSNDTDRVDLQSLGVDDRGVSAEAILYADGDVTIQNADSDGMTLDRGQVQNLVAFLIRHMRVDA